MKFFTLAAAVLVFGAMPMLARPAADGGAPQPASTPAPEGSPNVVQAQNAQAQDAPAPSPSNPPAPSTTQALPAGAVPLRVMVGKSLLINTTERLKRVSVTDPTVADALTVTPTQVLVNGLAPGEVSLLIWDELERSRSFDLRVDVDITAATEEMNRLFPDELLVFRLRDPPLFFPGTSPLRMLQSTPGPSRPPIPRTS